MPDYGIIKEVFPSEDDVINEEAETNIIESPDDDPDIPTEDEDSGEGGTGLPIEMDLTGRIEPDSDDIIWPEEEIELNEPAVEEVEEDDDPVVANTAVLPTLGAVQQGDRCIIALINGEATVIGTVGWGDAQNARISEVEQVAGDTNQYFWHTSTGTDTGAHITQIPQEQFLLNPSGGNTLIRSNGIAIRNGLTELATFTASGATIGNDDTSTVRITNQAFIASDVNDNVYLKIEDLHDEEHHDSYTILNANDDFVFWLHYAEESTVKVYVNGVLTSNWDEYDSTWYHEFEDGTKAIWGTYSIEDPLQNNDVIDIFYYPNIHFSSTSFSYGERLNGATQGLDSASFGAGNTASGTYSFAEGYINVASGIGAHAEGANNVASGMFSHVEGGYTDSSMGNVASGWASHAEGFGNTASAICSHAEGWGNTASDYWVHAEGRSTVASREAAHSEGSHTTASGLGSHAEGGRTTASGIASHAEGQNSQALNSWSHAEGYRTTSSGNSTHTEGSQTTATGLASHAEGENTSAAGEASHAGGTGTEAYGDSQTAIGQYNIRDTYIPEVGETWPVIKGKYPFIIGNGTGTSARSNAFTVDWEGNVECGLINGVDITDIGGGGSTIYEATSTNKISTSGIDNLTKGATITVPAGKYVIVGQWIFSTASASGTTNKSVRIYNDDDEVMIGQTRVYAAAYNYGVLQATAIAEFDTTTNLSVRGSSSRTITTESQNWIKAIKISGGGGSSYLAGNGITIANDEISIDDTVVALQTDLADKQDTLTAGNKITISSDNTISTPTEVLYGEATANGSSTYLNCTITYSQASTARSNGAMVVIKYGGDRYVYNGDLTDSSLGTGMAFYPVRTYYSTSRYLFYTSSGLIIQSSQVSFPWNNISGKPTNVSSFNNDAGYLTDYTETDPVFSASAASGITSSDITAWNGVSNSHTRYIGWDIINSVYTLYWNGKSSGIDITNQQLINSYSSLDSEDNNMRHFITRGAVSRALDDKQDALPSITGNANKVLAVNSGATGLEWVAQGGGGGGTYTAGTGLTLSNNEFSVDSSVVALQTDLFSGSYNDLTDKPTIPTYTAGTGISITNGVISLDLSQAESESF